jgi:hypothetical protein
VQYTTGILIKKIPYILQYGVFEIASTLWVGKISHLCNTVYSNVVLKQALVSKFDSRWHLLNVHILFLLSLYTDVWQEGLFILG